MKHTTYIICIAILAILILVQDEFMISNNRIISILRDSTSFYKFMYDSTIKIDRALFVEQEKEIKYWKDSAFFYCGKYYESLRVHNTHINNAKDVYIGSLKNLNQN